MGDRKGEEVDGEACCASGDDGGDDHDDHDDHGDGGCGDYADDLYVVSTGPTFASSERLK